MWYVTMRTSRQPVRFTGHLLTLQQLVTALGALVAHRAAPAAH